MDFHTNGLTTPQSWAKLLKETSHQDSTGYIGKRKRGIYLEISDRTGKLSAAEIGEISENQFNSAIRDAQKSIEGTSATNNYPNLEQARKFTTVSSDIVTYTEMIIKSREAKRDQFLNRASRGIALVFASLASFTLIGIPFLIKLIEDDTEFKNQINEMKDQVSKMREELKNMEDQLNKITIQKHQLDTMMNLLQKEMGCTPEYAKEFLSFPFSEINDFRALVSKINEIENKTTINLQEKEMLVKLNNQLLDITKRLNEIKNDIENNKSTLPLDSIEAANYTNLKKEVHDNLLPYLNDKDYPNLIVVILTGQLNEILKQYSEIKPIDRPAVVEQFAADIRRGASFKRIDEKSEICDKEPYPPSKVKKPLNLATKAINEVTPKIEEPLDLATKAINELIKTTEDEKWKPLLQAAATQTNLTAAFCEPLGRLSELSMNVHLNDDSFLLPDFPKELPPVELEITRDFIGNIQKVTVTVKGSLDLVKANATTYETTDSTDETTNPHEVFFQTAIETTLSYTLTMEKGSACVSDLNITSTTKFPAIKSFERPKTELI